VIAISHIYIYATAIFISNFITEQTYGHNFGPDALARKQCRARVFAALGCALGAGPHGPVPPHLSDHAKSERTRFVLVLAAVGTPQLRRSRRGSSASNCAGSVCKRTYRYHLWLLFSLKSRRYRACPNGHQPFGTKAQHATLLMHLKRCNFRPTGPFGITLRVGCAIHRAVGLMPHCHWPSRTLCIYGTSRRVASCWA
jgi:hypothetical protein